MLKDLGHSMTEAASASHPLELLREGPRRYLVLTDYSMPGMTGLDLAAELRRMPSAPPILLVTGYAQLLGHEADDVPLLPKPFRRSALAERLARMVDSEIEGASIDTSAIRAAS